MFPPHSWSVTEKLSNDPKLQKFDWRTSTSTVNENSKVVWRSIIAVAITGYFGTDLLKF
jgi:hypothetical protein